MTDYKKLCAELVEKLDELNCHYNVPNQSAIIERALVELDEPEPEWPTDEEIMELMPQQMRDDLAAAARAMSGFDPDNIKAASVFRIILNRHSVDHARAVLARWGNHPGSPDSSAQPVPVSERLPGPTDEELCDLMYEFTIGTGHGERLDETGFARAVLARWGNHPGSPDSSTPQPMPAGERPGPKDFDTDGRCWWFFPECPGENSYWILAREVYCNSTHWLPAHALPLPNHD